MHELIKITNANFSGQKVNAVDGRELHAFLGVGKVFAAWMPEQIEAYGFLEHQDFEVFSESGKNPSGGRPAKEYLISLPMAKELAMVQRTPKGKEARLYFIECERRLSDPVNRLLAMDKPELLEMAATLARDKQALSMKVQEQAEDIQVLEPKAAFADQVARAGDLFTMAQAAKLLGTGRTRLFVWLRQAGFLYQEGREHIPYQQFVDSGVFKVVLEPFEDSHGRDRCYAKVMITGKGLVAIQRARLAEGAQPLVKPQHTFTNCKPA
jgi:anti-repressor protein